MGIGREIHHWLYQIVSFGFMPAYVWQHIVYTVSYTIVTCFSYLFLLLWGFLFTNTHSLALFSAFRWFEMDFLGNYQGHITIVPELSLATISQALSNPSQNSLITATRV